MVNCRLPLVVKYLIARCAKSFPPHSHGEQRDTALLGPLRLCVTLNVTFLLPAISITDNILTSSKTEAAV